MRRLLPLFVLLAACSTKDSGHDPRERSFWDALWTDSYTETFEDHTKRESVLSEFEPVMTVHATLWDQSMREAYVKEMSRQYRYNNELEKKLADEQVKEDQAYMVFVLSAATREPEWNEFEKKNSIWRITLENTGGDIQIDPERIEYISQKDEKAKFFYQRMGHFTRTYRVRFPRKDLHDSRPLKLHISGARGFVTFLW